MYYRDWPTYPLANTYLVRTEPSHNLRKLAAVDSHLRVGLHYSNITCSALFCVEWHPGSKSSVDLLLHASQDAHPFAGIHSIKQP